jgi:multidrug efflux system membrane fusion protein
VRNVGASGRVGFLPVTVIEDEQSQMWVAGIPDSARVIVRGQDFVREGQEVEAVEVEELTATMK